MHDNDGLFISRNFLNKYVHFHEILPHFGIEKIVMIYVIFLRVNILIVIVGEIAEEKEN